MSLIELPVEVIQIIYSYFTDTKSLRSVCLTCRRLNEASKNKQVYRNIFENIYDHGYLAHQYEYETELKERRRFEADPQRIDAANLTTLQNMLFEIEATIEPVMSWGKNTAILQAAKITRLLESDLSTPSVHKEMRPMLRSLCFRVTFLTLSSLCGKPSSWEQRYLAAANEDDQPVQSLDIDVAIVLFTYEDLFSTTITRSSDSNSFTASIIYPIPPLDFAGARHTSTPNWQIFLALLKFMIYVKWTSRKNLIVRHDIPRPRAVFHPSVLRDDHDTKTYSWVGIYVYLDFDAFQWLASEQTDFDPRNLYSDGTQTCDFTLLPDGQVTGSGRGTWGRTRGGRYTLEGTWTTIRACPPGFKRVTFHKIYQNELATSRWLYDGMIVPGVNGGIYLGRWRDDTVQAAGETAVTGPFIFWRPGS